MMKINEVENDKFMERVVSATFNLLVPGFHLKVTHTYANIFIWEHYGWKRSISLLNYAVKIRC